METKLPQSDDAAQPPLATASPPSSWSASVAKEPVATDSADMRREQWREREGHAQGGRYGNRGGGANAKWHTAHARAKQFATASNLDIKKFMREWLEANPKPSKAARIDVQQ